MIFIKTFIVIFLLCTLSFSQQKKSHSILKNWIASQVGEFTGFAITGLSYRTLEELDLIKFSTDEQRRKNVFLTGIFVGNFSGNFFLKIHTNQNYKSFICNILFSSIPVATYSVIVKPKFKETDLFWKKYRDETGLLLVSMFVTPIFSTIGFEIFNKKQKKHKISRIFEIQPYILKSRDICQIGIKTRF